MPTRRRLIIAGFLTLVAGLIILFPARVAYNWIAPPGVMLSGISGSIWSGAARRMTIEDFYIGDLTWQARPHRLLLGQMAYSIQGKPAAGFIESDLAIGFGGTIYFNDLIGSFPVHLLEQVSGIRGLRGNASVNFEQLIISGGMPISMSGTLEVSGLTLPLVAPTPIGGYRAVFFTQEDGIVASIEDTDGVVDLAGSFKLTPDRNYRFLGQLAAKPETPSQVRQQMVFLGTPNERDQYELRLEGQL